MHCTVRVVKVFLHYCIHLLQASQEVPEWLEEIAESAVGTSYGPAGGRFASRDTRRQVDNFVFTLQ